MTDAKNQFYLPSKYLTTTHKMSTNTHNLKENPYFPIYYSNTLKTVLYTDVNQLILWKTAPTKYAQNNRLITSLPFIKYARFMCCNFLESGVTPTENFQKFQLQQFCCLHNLLSSRLKSHKTQSHGPLIYKKKNTFAKNVFHALSITTIHHQKHLHM